MCRKTEKSKGNVNGQKVAKGSRENADKYNSVFVLSWESNVTNYINYTMLRPFFFC